MSTQNEIIEAVQDNLRLLQESLPEKYTCRLCGAGEDVNHKPHCALQQSIDRLKGMKLCTE